MVHILIIWGEGGLCGVSFCSILVRLLHRSSFPWLNLIFHPLLSSQIGKEDDFTENFQARCATNPPSISTAPSHQPSYQPSVSAAPSNEPTEEPSISTHPTISTEPTASPSANPTRSPPPSTSPSISFKPSHRPSNPPSVSLNPTRRPTVSTKILTIVIF